MEHRNWARGIIIHCSVSLFLDIHHNMPMDNRVQLVRWCAGYTLPTAIEE